MERSPKGFRTDSDKPFNRFMSNIIDNTFTVNPPNID